ncbi:hypothetical protein F5Y11DRAFT_309532 [Daldinia sp. FL1419]|nr:hypothetical protein F5Y11DRAFT_309532 [Daldinia sp. FL1419]
MSRTRVGKADLIASSAWSRRGTCRSILAKLVHAENSACPRMGTAPHKWSHSNASSSLEQQRYSGPVKGIRWPANNAGTQAER